MGVCFIGIASLRGYAAPLAWRCYRTAYGVGCGGAAGRGVAVGVSLAGWVARWRRGVAGMLFLARYCKASTVARARPAEGSGTRGPRAQAGGVRHPPKGGAVH